MNYKKYADSAIIKSEGLLPALVGTSMALLLMGKVFDTSGYTFLTVGPSVLLILCLWLPYFYRR